MSQESAKDGLITEPISKQHDRATFASGAPELDTYLKKQARQDARRNVAAPFVIRAPDSNTVIGYYTLSATSAALDGLPAQTARKLNLSHYPEVPAFLLGRLAVDNAHRSVGLGKRLLLDALRRCWEQNAQVAAALVIVDARDDGAARFYAHFGFQPFPDYPDRFFLPMQTVASLFQ